MIKKQYSRFEPGYFSNFISSHDGELVIDDELKKYGATIAKSKNCNYKMNVKWRDPVLYSLFVIRWA